MERRTFISALLAVPVFEKIGFPEPEVCGLCHKPGHKMHGATVRKLFDEHVFPAGEARYVIWCENAPIDWSFYQLTIHKIS